MAEKRRVPSLIDLKMLKMPLCYFKALAAGKAAVKAAGVATGNRCLLG
jgi:hypothetical protein